MEVGVLIKVKKQVGNQLEILYIAINVAGDVGNIGKKFTLKEWWGII